MSLSLDFYAPGAGLISSRTDWSKTSTQLIFNAGPTEESHEDRAQGEFLLFRSDWLCAEAKLASHSGIAGDCSDHCCVSFGGQAQTWTQDGVKILASEFTPAYTFLSANLSPAYVGQCTSYQRSLFFLKGAASQYLLVKDEWAGNTQPAVFHLQTLVQPAIGILSFAAVYPGATLFGVNLNMPDWTKTSVSKSVDQVTPSWRLDLPDGGANEFCVALEASPAAASGTLKSVVATPGLRGVGLGSDFAAWLTGPGPWKYVSPVPGKHYLLGLKPNTSYTVDIGGSLNMTSSSAGVLVISVGTDSRPIIVTEGSVVPPQPPTATGRTFQITVPSDGSAATIKEIPSI